MENKYRVTFDVDVSFDIENGEVSLSFGDTQLGVEYEIYAESQREAIQYAKEYYEDDIGRYMGKDFPSVLYIEYHLIDAEELDDE